MKSTEIQHNVQNLIDNFSKDEFVFDLLIAYGISKTSVTRLKKGDYNLSKVEGEILYKKKIFFKVEATDKLLSSIDTITKEERILKHKPRFAILTDYKQIVAKDLLKGKNLDVKIKELPNYFDFFLPLAGSEVYNASNNNEADRNASYKMASLYDLLIEENPNIYNSKESIHHLNIFLSRLLFCFFAEDTEIFKTESIFTDTLAQHTVENGKDTNTFLDELFDRLNTEKVDHLPDYLRKFEYVNGGLFSQKISSPRFTSKARKTLIELGELQWKDINPDIFGSMIQAVVDKDYRSDLGMHYTSVENILKLIKPLFLDELYEEFENATTVKQLNALIQRISKIKFFDPACGSGNFLIITYKEIRLLEIKILQKITDLETTPTFKWTSVNLSQFYGIEIDDFAHEMAILSLWLAEHQMNRVFEEMLFDYGKSKPILPLKEAGQIQQGNATRRDWNSVCPITEKDEVYVIGNPPYLGYKGWDEEQKKDMSIVFNGFKTVNRLDYISCWFKKGADYIKGMNAKLAFVSTNSICQGEQVSLIWPYLLNSLEINFAYNSFKWTNNAKGSAGVSVVIISLRNISDKDKVIFDENFKTLSKNINPYLTSGSNIFIQKRDAPISNLPEMALGSSGIDGGHLILSKEEREEFFRTDSTSKKFIKKFVGGNDFLNGVERYCLWIEDDKIEEAYNIKPIKDRVDKCEIYRLNAGRDARKAAEVPHRFFYRKYQSGESIIIPMTSSSNRNYIPVGIEPDGSVLSNGVFVIYNFSPFHFGILSSKLHLLWAKAVGGKMREDIRYSVNLVYNTFPFPDITTKQKENLNQYVFDILDERAKHPSKTMAQLYNPATMPKGLLQAHQALDTAIEQCYRLQPFKNDTERLEYLFKQYEEMVKKDTLFAKQKKTRNKRVKK
ncbi:N-6 DNA methylase [Aequorivita todarodis]|uniref:class I SAM-dependent DNA methyltransferase n=1 Tax=Aequorivita todarodis TaxID=2036821 RepID=UPI0023500EAA|nr:DNA methyltransferase [Aequorivita todarodis]MDC8001395.1 N-6 DNA methylase [Aequorivita todarodis]